MSRKDLIIIAGAFKDNNCSVSTDHLKLSTRELLFNTSCDIYHYTLFVDGITLDIKQHMDPICLFKGIDHCRFQSLPGYSSEVLVQETE